jgi:hypothetical protein
MAGEVGLLLKGDDMVIVWGFTQGIIMEGKLGYWFERG